MHAIHGIASGRVQGVFYRASLQREAQKRGLTGWVRNRADGTVEFVVQGDAGAVESIVEWANGNSRFIAELWLTQHVAMPSSLAISLDHVSLQLRH